MLRKAILCAALLFSQALVASPLEQFRVESEKAACFIHKNYNGNFVEKYQASKASLRKHQEKSEILKKHCGEVSKKGGDLYDPLLGLIKGGWVGGERIFYSRIAFFSPCELITLMARIENRMNEKSLKFHLDFLSKFLARDKDGISYWFDLLRFKSVPASEPDALRKALSPGNFSKVEAFRKKMDALKRAYYLTRSAWESLLGSPFFAELDRVIARGDIEFFTKGLADLNLAQLSRINNYLRVERIRWEARIEACRDSAYASTEIYRQFREALVPHILSHRMMATVGTSGIQNLKTMSQKDYEKIIQNDLTKGWQLALYLQSQRDVVLQDFADIIAAIDTQRALVHESLRKLLPLLLRKATEYKPNPQEVKRAELKQELDKLIVLLVVLKNVKTPPGSLLGTTKKKFRDVLLPKFRLVYDHIHKDEITRQFRIAHAIQMVQKHPDWIHKETGYLNPYKAEAALQYLNFRDFYLPNFRPPVENDTTLSLTKVGKSVANEDGKVPLLPVAQNNGNTYSGAGGTAYDHPFDHIQFEKSFVVSLLKARNISVDSEKIETVLNKLQDIQSKIERAKSPFAPDPTMIDLQRRKRHQILTSEQPVKEITRPFLYVGKRVLRTGWLPISIMTFGVSLAVTPAISLAITEIPISYFIRAAVVSGLAGFTFNSVHQYVEIIEGRKKNYEIKDALKTLLYATALGPAVLMSPLIFGVPMLANTAIHSVDNFLAGYPLSGSLLALEFVAMGLGTAKTHSLARQRVQVAEAFMKHLKDCPPAKAKQIMEETLSELRQRIEQGKAPSKFMLESIIDSALHKSKLTGQKVFVERAIAQEVFGLLFSFRNPGVLSSREVFEINDHLPASHSKLNVRQTWHWGELTPLERTAYYRAKVALSKAGLLTEFDRRLINGWLADRGYSKVADSVTHTFELSNWEYEAQMRVENSQPPKQPKSGDLEPVFNPTDALLLRWGYPQMSPPANKALPRQTPIIPRQMLRMVEPELASTIYVTESYVVATPKGVLRPQGFQIHFAHSVFHNKPSSVFVPTMPRHMNLDYTNVGELNESGPLIFVPVELELDLVEDLATWENKLDDMLNQPEVWVPPPPIVLEDSWQLPEELTDPMIVEPVSTTLPEEYLLMAYSSDSERREARRQFERDVRADAVSATWENPRIDIRLILADFLEDNGPDLEDAGEAAEWAARAEFIRVQTRLTELRNSEPADNPASKSEEIWNLERRERQLLDGYTDELGETVSGYRNRWISPMLQSAMANGYIDSYQFRNGFVEIINAEAHIIVQNAGDSSTVPVDPLGERGYYNEVGSRGLAGNSFIERLLQTEGTINQLDLRTWDSSRRLRIEDLSWYMELPLYDLANSETVTKYIRHLSIEGYPLPLTHMSGADNALQTIYFGWQTGMMRLFSLPLFQAIESLVLIETSFSGIQLMNSSDSLQNLRSLVIKDNFPDRFRINAPFPVHVYLGRDPRGEMLKRLSSNAFPKLESLTLDNFRLNSEQAGSLLETKWLNRDTFQELHLVNCDLATTGMGETLAKRDLSHLTALNLKGSTLIESELHQLFEQLGRYGKLASLRSLNLSDMRGMRPGQTVAQASARAENVRFLDLEPDPLHPGNWRRRETTLGPKNLDRLEILSMSGNHFGPSSANYSPSAPTFLEGMIVVRAQGGFSALVGLDADYASENASYAQSVMILREGGLDVMNMETEGEYTNWDVRVRVPFHYWHLPLSR